ncbi:hypothetical protein KP509_24G060000 [Ceratopteris richardii]|uniref:Cox19-like CHCH family protein n=1 Tax=Ceratopteris richardii TaxID=49495 RepID=A0A8T2RVQ8_CERRI|nr:hypothetical protein KP509_24G060000 [Ceratopteris richardii]
MTKSEPALRPPCGEEALALLNCVAASSYDSERCIILMSALRSCIEKKKVIKFSLSEGASSKGSS